MPWKGGSTFSVDMFALFVASIFTVLAYLLWRRLRFATQPHLFFSNINSLMAIVPSWRVKLAVWPQRMMWLGLLAFILAFIDPHLFIKKHPNASGFPDDEDKPPPTEGIAIYLLLDQSGSMTEEIPVYSHEGMRKRMTKIDLLKQVTRQFIIGSPALGLSGRSNDMIGIITFARGAQVMSPLTLDHRNILEQLSHFKAIGNRDQDGTAIGYAIYKAASLIAATRHYSQELVEKGEAAYTIKNSIIILVTDGLQDPNPLDKGKRLRNMDIPDAAAYAKQQGVRLYIVNVEPKMAEAQFAPNRRQMQRSAELTGGRLFIVDYPVNLENVYQEIDRLETSALPPSMQEGLRKEDRPDLYRRLSWYPYFIGCGLILLLSGLMLESTLFRRVP